MTIIETPTLMHLKILGPCAVLLDCPGVSRLMAESGRGFFGLWPRRLDCAAALVPGILSYQAGSGEEQYVAHDRGVLVKNGFEVLVSVRSAVVGADLGSLRQLVEERFSHVSQTERQMRSMVAKIESEIIRETAKFRQN